MYRRVDVEPLRNLDRLRIGPGGVTKTEVETLGWAAVQLLQGLVLLLVLLLVLDGEKRIVLSVLHLVVMQGLTLCNLISLVPPPVLTCMSHAGGVGQTVNLHAGWTMALYDLH